MFLHIQCLAAILKYCIYPEKQTILARYSLQYWRNIVNFIAPILGCQHFNNVVPIIANIVNNIASIFFAI